MEAKNDEKNDEANNEEEQTDVVQVGTATVIDDTEDVTTTTISNLEKGKEHLQQMGSMINDVSKKMKSNYCLILA